MPTTQEIRKVAIVLLAGPIKHWWNQNWFKRAHWHYAAWREALSAGLVADGHYLVYRPHHAFKGTWTEEAQAVNDAALRVSNVVIDMTPPGVPSEGTVSEIKQASSSGAVIVHAPPPPSRKDFDAAIRELILHIESLGVHRDMVDQEDVIECISWQPGRGWLFQALGVQFHKNTFRMHSSDEEGRTVVQDVSSDTVRDTARIMAIFETDPASRPERWAQWRLLKVEVLNQPWYSRRS